MEIRGQNWTLDELGWERLEEPPAPWDGLSDLYPALVNTVWGGGDAAAVLPEVAWGD